MTAGKKIETAAVHLKDGDMHVVGLKSLRVHLSQDDGSWFAQGLEVDYAAAGKTIEEAKKNFETGLRKTITEHLRMHGGIEKLLHIAHQDAWNEFFGATGDSSLKMTYSTVDVHNLAPQVKGSGQKRAFPFDKIVFLEPELAHV